MFTISQAKITDILEIKEVNQACKIYSYSFDYYAYLMINFPDLNYIVKNKKGKIIGFILAQIKKQDDVKTKDNSFYPLGHIVGFGILDEYRRKGQGTNLLNQVFKNMVKYYQMKKCYLEVQEGNPVITLYKKYGFKTIEKLPDYYGQGNDGYKMIADPLINLVEVDS